MGKERHPVRGGQPRWSRPQRELYKIIDPAIGFQIHSMSYDDGCTTGFPRYWATIGKEIVYDWPKDYNKVSRVWYDTDVESISCLIRAYIDCPVSELLTHAFNDRFSLLPLLQVCDRRIGKRRLAAMLDEEVYAKYRFIIERRLCTNRRK